MSGPGPYDPVERIATVMREHFAEPLTLSRLADEALLSPFHLSRLFLRRTGLSPGRYLGAVRLYEAKRLLLGSPFPVSDISYSVGYGSVSSFTALFTRTVGVSPGRFRSLSPDSMLAVAEGYQRLPIVAPRPEDGRSGAAVGSVGGPLRLPAGWRPRKVFIGVFDGPVPHAHPVACRSLADPVQDHWRLDGVPVGRWTVLALACRPPVAGTGPATLLIGAAVPVEVTAGPPARVMLEMRSPRPTDPPILFTVARPNAA